MSFESRPSSRPEARRYRQVSIGHPAASKSGKSVASCTCAPWSLWPRCRRGCSSAWCTGPRVRPEQTLIATREAGGDWCRVSYAQMLDSVRAIAQSLLGYGLSAEKPLALLSGNDIEHLQMALGAMYAGIPYCPVSPAYSLLSQDFAKLRHVCDLLQPGLVFVSEAAPFERAITAVLPADVPLITVRGEIAGRSRTSFASLLAQPRRRRGRAGVRRHWPGQHRQVPVYLQAPPNCPRR